MAADMRSTCDLMLFQTQKKWPSGRWTTQTAEFEAVKISWGQQKLRVTISVRRRSGPQVRPHTGTAQRRVIHPVPVQEAVGRQLSLSVPVGRVPGRWYVEVAGRAVGGESEQRGRGFSWLFPFFGDILRSPLLL